MASESTKLMKNSHLLDFWIDLAFLKEKSYYAARNKQQLIRDFFLAEASKKQSTNYNVRNKVADASFMVGETLGPKTYIIEGDNGIKTTVNIDQLKKSQVKDKIVILYYSLAHHYTSLMCSLQLPILLKFTSGPNAYNKEGRTPMLCAIANHYSIKELIEGSADINFPSRKKEDDSSTSLLLAARVKLTLRLLQNLQNGRDEAFSKLNIDNRKLLWHGTKLENVIGILSQELRVAPINAQLYPNMNVITKYSYPGIFPKKISAYYPSAASMKDTRNDINIVKLLLNKNHETEYIAYLEKVKKKEIKHKKKTELLSIESIVRKQNPQLPANVIFADELTEEEKHFKMKSNLDFNITDKNQKTVLHHLLSHFEFGSFDNLRMLQFLMCNGLKFEYEDYFPYLENGAVKIKKFLETIFEVDSSITKVTYFLLSY
ncbi:hypothetical protein GQR58_016761 [Nymphon striatum]|nr:hypothetical protein GQR58_016761 [Nymphon striatum]